MFISDVYRTSQSRKKLRCGNQSKHRSKFEDHYENRRRKGPVQIVMSVDYRVSHNRRYSGLYQMNETMRDIFEVFEILKRKLPTTLASHFKSDNYVRTIKNTDSMMECFVASDGRQFNTKGKWSQANPNIPRVKVKHWCEIYSYLCSTLVRRRPFLWCEQPKPSLCPLVIARIGVRQNWFLSSLFVRHPIWSDSWYSPAYPRAKIGGTVASLDNKLSNLDYTNDAVPRSNLQVSIDQTELCANAWNVLQRPSIKSV